MGSDLSMVSCVRGDPAGSCGPQLGAALRLFSSRLVIPLAESPDDPQLARRLSSVLCQLQTKALRLRRHSKSLPDWAYPTSFRLHPLTGSAFFVLLGQRTELRFGVF